MNKTAQWKLVADVRTNLMRRWLPLSATLLLILVAQTAGGRYEDKAITLLAWAWLGAGILPGTLLLYLSSWLNRYPAKLIAPGASRSLTGIVTIHLCLMLLTLLALPLAISSMALQEYLSLSFLWVATGSMLVTAGFFLLFFKKETKLHPNAQIILAVAETEAGKARQAGQLARLQCLELIAGNKLEQAFEYLKSSFHGNLESTDHAVLLQARFNNVTEKQRMGLLDNSEAQLEINKITEALLNLSKMIKQ